MIGLMMFSELLSAGFSMSYIANVYQEDFETSRQSFQSSASLV